MADTLDVLTLAEGRTVTGLTGTTANDTTLAEKITAVSRQLDKMAGPVVVRTITAETHDGGQPTIRLRRIPVSSITTVTEYNGTTGTTITAETNASKTSTNYIHDGQATTIHSGLLRRRNTDTDACWEAGRRNIEVTYIAGRFATTAAVDAQFKAAASMMLRHVWQSEQASGTETFGAYTDQPINPLLGPGMLNKVAAMLEGELLDGVYVG